MLSSLNEINLSNNGFEGDIPTELEFLTTLQILDLSSNSISGSLPSTFNRFTSLTDLRLSRNDIFFFFSETYPLTNLRTLHLSESDMFIPTFNFDQWPFMKELRIDGNYLTSTIPTNIGTMDQLEIFHMYNMKCSDTVPNECPGTLPTELGLLTDLIELNLSGNDVLDQNNGNNFSGTLPTEIGHLTKLRLLNLYNPAKVDHAGLTGTIPTKLGNLSSLTELNLYSNDLTGPISFAETGGGSSTMSNLQFLDLSLNRLTGTLPAPFINILTSLTSLYLFHNNFSGNIPTEIGSMSKLTVLSLRGNPLII